MFAGKSSRFGTAQLVILIVVLAACTAPPVETNPAPMMPSSTLAPGATAAPTDTPTEVPTSTPLPILILTPQPEWVTAFAQPILDALADRPPDFEDDFHDKSGGWHFDNFCGDWRMRYVDGELVITVGNLPGSTVGNDNCNLHRNNIGYTDFAVEVDGHFLPETNGFSEWRIEFRYVTGEVEGVDYFSRHSLGINYHQGELGVGSIMMNGPDLDLPQQLITNGSNRLMVIAKGSRFAFYLNGGPLYYVESIYCPYGDIYLQVVNHGDLAKDTIVAFDSFKIWNIANLP